MPILSPCNAVCKMDENSGLCLGCWRTIDEIVAWGSRSDDEKKKILALIKLRKDVVENAGFSISNPDRLDKTP
jgi:uncharacterized protein